MNAKRGYVSEDDKNFSAEAIEKMKTASRHVLYLINEGYDIKQATLVLKDIQKIMNENTDRKGEKTTKPWTLY